MRGYKRWSLNYMGFIPQIQLKAQVLKFNTYTYQHNNKADNAVIFGMNNIKLKQRANAGVHNL